MARRSRLPGLHVPGQVTGDVRSFLEAVKERLELIGGERGDSAARGITRAELNAALAAAPHTNVNTANQGAATASNRTSTSVEDLTLYPPISAAQVGNDRFLLVQGGVKTERFRLSLQDLFALFLRTDYENEVLSTMHFVDELGFDITGTSPRFMLIEEPLGDGIENSLPADSTIWDVHVDSGVLSLRTRNDNDDGGNAFFEASRTADNADLFDVTADVLAHKGINVTAFSAYEANLGSLPRYSGSFDITGLTNLTSGKPVHIWQASVAYTGKGSLADESEMDHVIARGYVLNATTIRVHWSVDRANGPVKGNVAFNYRIGT